MSSPRRLALFGGSFDPIHAGHLEVARRAREAFDLDRVILMPAARPPHKEGVTLAAPHHRLAMAALVAALEPWLAVSDLELLRAGPSYTYDTLVALPAAVGEPEGVERWFILGSDNLAGLADWYRAGELLALARPIVVLRDERDWQVDRGRFERLGPGVWERLRAGRLDLPPHPGRARRIRAALARGEESPQLLPAVSEYIRREGLYRSR